MIRLRDLKEKQLLRYLFKWLIIIFIIFITVSIFLNLYIYYKEESHYANVVEEGQSERLNYLAKQLESEIAKMKVATYFTLKENEILDLYALYDHINSVQKDKLISTVANRCMEITNTNSFIKNASFYLKEQDLEISPKGYNIISHDVFQKYVDMAKQSKIISYDEDGQAFIMDPLNVDYLGEKWNPDNIAGLFVIEVDIKSFENELRYAKLTENDILFMTDLDGEHIIAGTSPVDENVLDVLRESKSKLEWNGNEYQVFSSHQNGVKYKVHYLQHQENIPFYHNRLVLNLILFGVLILISVAFCTNLFFTKIFRPLEVLLVDAFGQVRESNFQYRIPISKNEVFANLYDSFNLMAQRIDTFISKELKQEILINQANFKHLQAQINPHFMYNSYFILYRLIKMNDKESSLYVCENLGKFFKYITKDSKTEKRLFEEIAHAQSYAAIQGCRYKGKMKIVFDDLPEQYTEIIVPRLIVQPIIENVFKYVVDELYDEEEILLQVNYAEADGWLIICIENSGTITDEELGIIQNKIYGVEEKEDITALININQRLNIYFNQERSIEVFRSGLGGLEVHIKVRK